MEIGQALLLISSPVLGIIGAKLEAVGSDVARVADDAIYMHTGIDLTQVRASIEELLDDVYAGIAESRTIMEHVTSFAQAVSGAPIATGAGTSRLPDHLDSRYC